MTLKAKERSKVAFLGFDISADLVSLKLRKAGIKVVWILKSSDNGFAKQRLSISTVYRMPNKIGFTYIISYALKNWLYPLYCFLIIIFLNAKVIYILSWSIRNTILLNLLISFSKKMGKKIVYPIGDIPIIYEKNSLKRLNFIDRISLYNLFKSYTKIDLLLVTNFGQYNFVKDVCKRFGGCKKISVSYYGADLRFFNKHIPSYGIRQEHDLDEHFLIGWIGHKGNIKKVPEIVEALCHHFKGQKVSFVIGGDIDYEKIKKIERETNVRIICLGLNVPLDVSGRVYKECDLIIAPNNIERFWTHISFPTKLFEATAIRKPVVATMTKNNLKMIKNLPNVIAVNSEPQNFVDAVQRFLERHSEFTSLTEQIPSTVIEKISLQYFANREAKYILTMLN